MIAAVLVVPAADWRERLLGDGVCGARVPRAELLTRAGQWGPARHDPALDTDLTFALVLAWAGAVVPEGRDRAARVLAEREGRKAAGGALWLRLLCPGWALLTARQVDVLYLYDVEGGPPPSRGDFVIPAPAAAVYGVLDAYALAVVLVARGLAGRVVLLDEAGREVAP